MKKLIIAGILQVSLMFNASPLTSKEKGVIGAIVVGAVIVTAATAGIGGYTLQKIANNISKANTNKKHYAEALSIWGDISGSLLFERPEKKLKHIIRNMYSGNAPYSIALKDIKQLEKQALTAHKLLSKIIINLTTENQTDSSLYKHAKKLETQICTIKKRIMPNKAIIQKEYDFETTVNTYKNCKTVFRSLLKTRILQKLVYADMHQAISSAIANIGGEQPISDMLDTLRNIIQRADEELEACDNALEFCIQKKEKRYEPYISLFETLINEIETHIPYADIQRRIYEILSNECYKEEIKIREMNKHHKELIETLNNMAKGIKQTLRKQQETIYSMLKQGNRNLERTTHDTQNKIAHIQSNISSMHSDLQAIQHAIQALQRTANTRIDNTRIDNTHVGTSAANNTHADTSAADTHIANRRR